MAKLELEPRYIRAPFGMRPKMEGHDSFLKRSLTARSYLAGSLVLVTDMSLRAVFCREDACSGKHVVARGLQAFRMRRELNLMLLDRGYFMKGRSSAFLEKIQQMVFSPLITVWPRALWKNKHGSFQLDSHIS